MPKSIALKPYSYAIAAILKKAKGEPLSIPQIARRLHAAGWAPPIKPLRPLLAILVHKGLAVALRDTRPNGYSLDCWAWVEGAAFRVDHYTKSLSDNEE